MPTADKNKVRMRKVFYLVAGLILISIISVYVFIPPLIVVSKVEQVESSERIISQFINNPAQRAKWWTGLPASDGFQFNFMEPGYNSTSVLITNKDLKYTSKITWISYANNVIEIRWRTSQKASLNPARRVQQYIEARRLKSAMAAILERLLSFTIDTRNVYSLNIERQTVQDTLFATTSFKSTEAPDTHDIYRVIDSVKSIIKKEGVTEINAPMLNVYKDAKGFYITTIGLPIARPIKPDQKVLVHRMVRGNILVAEVKGGPGRIKNAFNQIEAYMKDFHLSSPAIPYELLVTDRRIKADTSEWVTKIYYPIY